MSAINIIIKNTLLYLSCEFHLTYEKKRLPDETSPGKYP